MATIPPPVYYPPFNITRVSHAKITVRDLERSLAFYTRVLGLVVSEREGDEVWLRGNEEVGHHSLILRRSDEPPLCEYIGLRVLTELELEKAEAHFRSIGLAPEWVERRGQGRTLFLRDPFGMPMEFCARMDLMPRHTITTDHFPGAAALRFDHVQVHSADIPAACAFYTGLGFRTSDYLVGGPDDTLIGVFMHRKDTPWDIVFMPGAGPRLHHFAYVTPSVQDMMKACDAAGIHRFGHLVERGPGRHNQGHVQYTYFRDPDGHRVEIIPEPPHQMLDIEQMPVRWDEAKRKATMDWGYPPPQCWYDDASRFAGVEPRPGMVVPGRISLEQYLAQRAAE
ncbi:MAG: VOC family protein [Rhodovarius sp.]|nr:VOC family protein [Rhodovarius sp.]MCX7933544.1 VOC family protein [Rhodovarius sp.]MDW8313696.1 VOC family protein [Rhodovarius sp.]